MKIENGTLIVDEAVGDESVEEFLVTLDQDGIKRVHLQNNDLGAAIVQALILSSRQKEIVVDDPVLQKIFENIHFLQTAE